MHDGTVRWSDHPPTSILTACRLSFAIGLATKDADLMKPTAHQLDAWSYCADDVAEHNNHPGRAWGQRLEKNDTLGCGIIFRENTVFFTKNGYRLGLSRHSVKSHADSSQIIASRPSPGANFIPLSVSSVPRACRSRPTGDRGHLPLISTGL